MASRVEKYYNEPEPVINRSQKNQILYEAISELDKITEDELAKLQKLFEDYEGIKEPAKRTHPKEEKSRKQLNQKIYEELESILEYDTSYDDPLHYDVPYYNALDYKVDQTPVDEKEEKKIRELLDAISTHLDVLEKQESHLHDLKKNVYHPSKQTKQKIDVKSLFENKIQKPIKKDTFVTQEKNDIEERKSNLKVKIIVGIAFIINFIIIILIIYNAVR